MKSLAEIRAEKQRLLQASGGDDHPSAPPGDQEPSPAAPGPGPGKEEGEEEEEKARMEAEKKWERRARIWSRMTDEDKPDKTATTGKKSS